MLTYIVFLFFLSIVLYGIIQKKWMAGLFIVMVYALSSFCSIFLLMADPTFLEPTIIPTILYCGLLFITLKPFIREKPVLSGFRSYSEQKRFIFVGYALSIAVILGMIIILPKITNVIDYGLVEARNAMYHGDQVNTTKDGPIMKFGALLVGYFGDLWYLYIIMFFYSLVYIKGKIFFKLLLIVASLAQIEVGLTVGGRTNAMYWLLSFLFTLILFYPYLTRKTRKMAISASLVFFLVVFAYVAFITFQRSLFRDGGTESFLLSYVGMPYLYFCEFFDKIDWHPYTLERIFPFFSYLMGTGFNLERFRELIEQHTGLDIGIFYTFMGDIYVDIGLIGLLLFIFVYFRVSSSVLRPHVFYLKDLFYLSLIYIIPLHGIFYYSLWKSGDINILLVLFISRYITKGIKTKNVSMLKS